MRLALVLLLMLLPAPGRADAIPLVASVQLPGRAPGVGAFQRTADRARPAPARPMLPARRPGLSRLAAASTWMVLLGGLLVAPARLSYGWRGNARRRCRALALADAELRAQRQRLRVRRLQLLARDTRGSEDARSWKREKARFCQSRIVPLLAARRLADQWPGIADTVDRRIERTASRPPSGSCGGFDPRMPPIEYERLCALLLRRAGWDARVTAGGGDQGTDVLAHRGRRSLVLQCKLYGRPVGNRAVQQVAAARAHHHADYAAVVSNADFTRHARELAASNQVELLHHEELRRYRSPRPKQGGVFRSRR